MNSTGNSQDNLTLNGETVAFLRRKNLMTIEALASAAECCRKTIMYIERETRTSNGVSVRHRVRPSLAREIAKALQVSPDLLQLPVEKVQELLRDADSSKTHVSSVARFINQPTMVELASQPLFAPDILKDLRDKLAMAESLGDAEYATVVKKRIKEICVFIEWQFTKRAAEQCQGGVFRYSDSSMIDAGIVVYDSDDSWKALLYFVGEIARRHGGSYSRTLFVEPRALFDFELDAIHRVVLRHLNQCHSVALVDDSCVKGDLRSKRNMGAMSGRALVAATDQLVWDLDFSDLPTRVSDAECQHEAFSSSPVCEFAPADNISPERIKAALSGVFRPITQT